MATILSAYLMHHNSRIPKNPGIDGHSTTNSASPPLRFVLDTNIIMDMLHFGDAGTTDLLSAIKGGSITCFTDSACFAEFERVTTYPAFELNAYGREALHTRYRAWVTFCEPHPDEIYPLPRCRDPDDQKFLILAARCKADALITRDKMLLKLAHLRHRPVPFSIFTASTMKRYCSVIASRNQ